MSQSQPKGNNLAECKDCKANGVITQVLWVDNPETGKRMPIDYKTLLDTQQRVRHNCPYWKKTGTIPATATVTAPAPVPQIADSRMTQIPLPQGQATLPTTTAQLLGSLPAMPMNLRIEPNSHTDSIFTNLVLALQEVADKLKVMNEYLEILANREVKQHPGIKSALQAKEQDSDRIIHGAELLKKAMGFDPRYCDHDQEGTINEDTGICSNCGTSFPAFIKKQEDEQQEFPDEEQLEETDNETETSKRNRERNEDDFPPL